MIDTKTKFSILLLAQLFFSVSYSFKMCSQISTDDLRIYKLSCSSPKQKGASEDIGGSTCTEVSSVILRFLFGPSEVMELSLFVPCTARLYLDSLLSSIVFVESGGMLLLFALDLSSSRMHFIKNFTKLSRL